MNTIYDAISEIRKNAENEKDKGTRYERLVRYYLKNDPLWRERLSDVWMWVNAPANDGADIGIDLVAKDNEDGSYWAIQCKCYDDDATLHYSEVATFFGKTGNQGRYAHTMIVTTASGYSNHLNTVADEWGTVRIFTDDIAASEIDFTAWLEGKAETKRHFLEPRPHQIEAIRDCMNGFATQDRGQLIMACGTGKTLTSLRLAEELLKKESRQGGRILFLAPSISLVGQSMRVWANQSKRPMICAVVCSDAKASQMDSDLWENSLRDLPYPASTDATALYKQLRDADDSEHLVVVFSTYQSVQVVSDAQKLGLPPFDLAICDEAHRTTGAAGLNISKVDITEFVKIHDNAIIAARKRLYMTATPRIYGDRVKSTAHADSYVISSMDDEATFGPEFHRLSFGKAVEEKLLSDYKVMALTMSAEVASEVYQRAMSEEAEGFKITESARIIGCWKGLLDQGEEDGVRLHSAVSFCSTIPESKRITEQFQQIVDAYIDYEKEHEHPLKDENFRCLIDHVDGSMDSRERKKKLDWLEFGDGENMQGCRILSNAKCLSEGVDVPNLDAVLFLEPKRSQIDIIQAVGRVMRKFEGKKYGYIILPIVIPAGMTAESALDDNQTYAAVWDILKALRSHDERLDARINAIPYDRNVAKNVVTVKNGNLSDINKGKSNDEKIAEIFGEATTNEVQLSLKLNASQAALQEAVNALIVKRCGTKVYWDVWAKDVAVIAGRHIMRIRQIIQEEEDVRQEFQKFVRGLRASLNNSITEEQAVEMLSQHIITLPVFDALFDGADFAKRNPISIAMEQMLTSIRVYSLESEEEKKELNALYASVRIRAGQIQTDTGRQAVIKDLYENFFREAFKATSEKMGIVYTPTPVVDYILHATERLLVKEFGQHLADPNVHILDAFTGTGTFIVDLINDRELMPDDKLPYKYANEIHCNEIMLLAYYIATINIEQAYHARMGGNHYEAFPGAVLTDTFQMYEENDEIDQGVFRKNTIRALQQMDTEIHVLVGNPPWSVGQDSENDNNKNENYPTLDKRIAGTYAANSTASLKNSLYDSYIRAFRWSSDRIGNKGVVSFVTNGGWLRSNSANGFRKCLTEEFNSIYVFDLRGNQRTQGEQSRKEGGKIFGSGSRAPVAITILIKNPASTEQGVIRYHDIGNYLTRDDKLAILQSAVRGVPFAWDILQPDKYGDWLSQRDDSWYIYPPVGIEKFKSPSGIFTVWSSGVKTNRDAWVYGFSKSNVENMVKQSLFIYENERLAYHNKAVQRNNYTDVHKIVNLDEKKISWSVKLFQKLESNTPIEYRSSCMRTSMYRPYCKEYLYFDENYNERLGHQKAFFPLERGKMNISIILAGVGHGKEFSCLISDMIPCFDIIEKSQCFPLYWYEEIALGKNIRHDAITDDALTVFRSAYPHVFDGRAKKNGGSDLNKEDIFYYIYGILHSPEYRQRFEANLKKELPRIPLSANFKEFSIAGRKLADIHLNYEDADLYPVKIIGDERNSGRVEKMRWGKKKDPGTGKSVDDKTTLIYNRSLTYKDIPEEANRYVVNGRSPLEWMIDRYQVKTDKASGIINDPNDYSDDPCYISNLIRRLITVSMRTMEIVDSLPSINEIAHPADWPEAWEHRE